jgi:hypothetical protein
VGTDSYTGEYEEDYDEFPPDDYEHHGMDCDCDQCEYERDSENCGEYPPSMGGGCSMAGSEYCDFECPFRDEVLKRLDSVENRSKGQGEDDEPSKRI